MKPMHRKCSWLDISVGESQLRRHAKLLFFPITALALFILIVTALHTPPVRNYAFERLRSYLRSSRGIELNAGDFRYNLLTLSVQIDDLALRSKNAFTSAPFLTADSVRAGTNLVSIIRGKPVIEDVRLEGVDVHVVANKQGKNNLPSGTPGSSPESPFPLPFLISDLRAGGSSLKYIDHGQNLRIELARWTLKIEGSASTWSQSIQFQLKESGRLHLRNRFLSVNNVSLDMALKPESLELKELRLEFGDSRIQAEGTVNGFNPPQIDSSVTADLNAGTLAEFAGLEESADGDIGITASISGSPAEIVVSSKISGTGIGFGNFKRIDLKSAVTYDRGSGNIRIASLDAEAPYGSFFVQSNLSVSKKPEESSATVRFRGINMETITGNLIPVRIASRLHGDLYANWKGTNFKQAKTTANLSFTATRTEPAESVLPFSGRISASGVGERIALKIASGRTLGMDLKGNISLTGWSGINGKIGARTGAMKHHVSALEAFLGKRPGSLVGINLDGPLDVDADIGGTLAALEIAAQVDAPRMRLGRLPDVDLDARLHYSPEGVFFDNVNAMWKEQILTARGRIGLEGKRSKLNLNARVEDGSLGAVVAGLGKELPIEGTFELTANLEGTFSDVSLSTSVSVAELTAYGQDFGKLDLEAALNGNRIELKSLKLVQKLSDGDSGRLAATGSYDLDSGAYTIQTDAAQLVLSDLALPYGLSAAGDLAFSASGSGSVESPSLNAKMKLDGFRYAGRALGPFELTTLLEDQTAQLDVRLPQLDFVSNASIGIRNPFPAKFEAKADADLSKFELKLSKDSKLEGSVTAALLGSGNLARWKEGNLSLSVTELLLELGNGKIMGRTPLEFSYENRRLFVHSATLATGDSSLSLSGSLPLNRGTASDALNIVGNLDLSDMFAFIPENPGLAAGGILHVNAALHGSLGEIEPAVNLAITNGTFAHSALRRTLEHINLDAGYGESVAEVRSFSASLGPGTIKASGEFPLESLRNGFQATDTKMEKESHFSADVEGLRMIDLRSIPDAVTGTVGFHLEGKTRRLREPADLRMKISFSQFEFKTARYEIEQAEPVEVSIAGGTLSFDRLLLTAPKTRMEVRGTIGITGNRAIDMHLDGDINVGIAGLFSEAFKAEGESRFELDLSGTLPAPEVSGFWEMKQGEFAVQTPALNASNLSIRLRFGSKTAHIENFTGSFNGGRLEATGTIGYGKSGPQDMDMDISIKNAFLNYPEGLRIRISTDLKLRSEDEFIILGGTAHILEGSYRRRMDVAQELIGTLQSGSGLEFTREENPFLSRLRFDIDIDTHGPLVVDNNLAELGANADIRLTGAYYRPGLIGRVSLEEGGELRFNQRTYLIERGTVSFFNQAEIEPDLDILATTRVSGYDISLTLTGTPEDFKADLNSDPPLAQSDIISILLTGRRLEDLRGSGLNVAREQAESYLSGQVGGFLSREAEGALGLSMVRIDPSLISPETNPGARLTVGQDITHNLYMIYSMNLVDASDQIITAQYDVTRRLQTEWTRQSDNSYRFDLRHDIQFGGASEKRRFAGSGDGESQIGGIEFQGDSLFSRRELLRRLKLDTGDRYDFFELQKGVSRLRRFYHERGYLECRIHSERKDAAQSVDILISIEAGPEVKFQYRGRVPSQDVDKSVRSAWSGGLFDQQRSFESIQAIRRSLTRKGYLQASVTSDVNAASENRKSVTFEIDEGVRYGDLTLNFEGASGLKSSELESALKEAKLTDTIHVEPEEVKNFLRDYYRQQGYLDAEIKDLRRELNPQEKTARIIIPLKEGPKFAVRKIEFYGNEALTESEILDSLPVSEGDDYNPELLLSSVDRLQEFYWTLGYNEVVVDYQLKRASKTGQLDIEFRITENRQQVVDTIEIEGNRETSERLIRSQLSLSPGDVLDYRKTNRSRRQLYGTGAYTLVDLQPEPLQENPSIAAGIRAPVALKVKVKEISPFRLQYGGFFDTERGPGGIAEFSNRNSLGSARLLGARVRYDSDVQELRGYFNQPILRRFPVKTDITGFFRKEFMQGQDTPDSGYTAEKTGFTLQQEAQFRNKFVFNYGYRFQHNRTYESGQNASPAETRITAPLTATLTRDTRNDLLDASRGSFLSQAFEYAPSYLGSDLRYYKYFGQYFHYLPLSEPTEIPWAGGKRSRLVLAGALRIGLAGGLDGQDLLRSDKFFAGGGTTLRGFGQNEVGPRDLSGAPAGGNALFILNSELRFPLVSVFDGVGFLDIGNVYRGIRDFNPTDVRASSGFGLRVRTPYFLLRADYGIKLGRKPGESYGKLFFSIGQAF
jgi:outer membrane protein assembly complex protein YaeT